jgi:hypothetical protein
MAYKLETLKIFPGGTNLVAPGDQVPAGDCLELTGFWPSSVGKLQQTQGYTVRAATGGGDPTAIAEENGRTYFATGALISQVGRGTFGGGFDGEPVGLVGFQRHMWIMNRASQHRDDGTNYLPWATETPALAPTDSTGTGEHLPDGEYEYFVTFIDNDFYESNPSPRLNVSLGPAADDGQITVTRPDAAIPANIFAWNLYRKSPNVFEKLKLNTAPIPYATTTYLDTGGQDQTEEDLIGFGEELEEDHDAPPAARVMADKPFNGRIVVASTADYPNRIYYTKSGQPAFFPRDNFVDVGADTGDAVLRISVKPGLLIVYREHSIWRQVGDFDDTGALMEPLVPEMGIVGPNAVAATSRGDYFVGGRASVAEGVYRLNDWAEALSTKVQPIFHPFLIENFEVLNQTWAKLCALGFNNGRLWFSYPESGETHNNRSLILDIETMRWFSRKHGFGTFYNGSRFFYAGGPETEGSIVSLEDTSTNDDGVAIDLAFQSEYQDCGLPDREKTWADLVIDHNTQDAALVVTIRTNKQRTGGGYDSFAVATIQSGSLTRETIPLIYPADYPDTEKRLKPIRARNLSVRIEGPGPVGGFCSIDSPILLHWYLEARGGMTFDTGITDHGTPALKTVYEVEADIDARGNWLLEISSDYPGGEMAVRDTIVLAPTNGREIVTYVLPTVREGKLLRYRLADGGDLGGSPDGIQVYGFRVKLVPIGVTLDGAAGEVWQTTPLAPGS